MPHWYLMEVIHPHVYLLIQYRVFLDIRLR